MRVRHTAVWGVIGVAWSVATACNLNPKPEDPGFSTPTNGGTHESPNNGGAGDGLTGGVDGSVRQPPGGNFGSGEPPPPGIDPGLVPGGPVAPPADGGIADAGAAADAADGGDANDEAEPVGVLQ